MKYTEKLKNNNLKLLSKFKDHNSQIKVQRTQCGHKFKITLNSINRNIRNNGEFKCPECERKSRTFTFEKVKDIVLNSTQKEYKVVSLKKDYKNTRSKISILHKTCGEITDLTYKNFSLGRRCRHCAAKTMNSKASELFKRLLKQINIEFIEEKKFDNCINPLTGRGLPFDFYIPKINTLIEIDGEQHFIPIDRFGGEEKLKEVKYRDFIKNKYCLSNNIKLIRVPLISIDTMKKVKYDEMKIIIFNLINDISIEYHKES